jgi:hypothetical protein
MHSTNGSNSSLNIAPHFFVVAGPAFPQSECPNAVIRHPGFTVRDDVFDGLSGPEFRKRKRTMDGHYGMARS